MNTNMHLNKVEQIVSAIHALDLDPIKLKLMDAEEGHGWPRAYADHVEIEYKRFLTLLVKYPDASIAPSKDVDKFWHGHILDTLKYAEDCNNVFGYFLHHFPYFGMRGAEDAANLAAAGNTMQQLYQHEFGTEQSAPESGWCAAAVTSAWCAASKDAASSNAPAWCAASVSAGTDVHADTAWCAASIFTKDAGVAWCAASMPNKTTAWCAASVVPQTVAATTAWCAASVKEAASNPAWCAASQPAKDATTAWCAASGSSSSADAVQSKNDSAWCAASLSTKTGVTSAGILNTSVRPTLLPSI